MKRTLFCGLALVALGISLLPAREVPCMVGQHDPEPFLFRFFAYAHYFMAQVNIWPFLFLQLLLCAALPCLVGLFLLPGLAAAGLSAGFLFMIFFLDNAGGILVIILTVITFGVPLVGSLLGAAVWVVLRYLLCWV